MKPVIIQYWIESEAGWGRRPDGISLHKTESDRKAFIQAYWASMPEQAPDEYSSPAGCDLIDIDEALYARIEGNGLRLYQAEYERTIPR